MDGATTEYTVDGISDVEVEETDSLLTTSEVASLLHAHINTVRRWSNLGILPSFRIGPRGDRRFREKDAVTAVLIFKQIGLLKPNKEWSGMDGVITEYPAERVTDKEVEETDLLLTPCEVANLLNIHINTVRRWSNLGVLKSLRIGPRGDRRFRKKDILTFLER